MLIYEHKLAHLFYSVNLVLSLIIKTQVVYRIFDNTYTNCIQLLFERRLILRIESLEIDDHILDKIEVKHRIDFKEVEDACFSEQRHIRKSKEGLYKIFGQSNAGRYILVVLVYKGKGDWKVATARQMTETEKRYFKKVT